MRLARADTLFLLGLVFIQNSKQIIINMYFKEKCFLLASLSKTDFLEEYAGLSLCTRKHSIMGENVTKT